MLDKTLDAAAALSGRYAGSQAYEALSDEQLLEWFVLQRQEAAFAALVRGHGPMVLAVCRRVLRHTQDAEDAFQATFLVLTQKASRLRKPKLLANWLYGVAYRTALHARQRTVQRSAREREASSMFAPENGRQVDPSELRQLLDEELNRLPEQYRAPLVLCYLEGKTNEEAARLLGWPSGSISHRLARGRELLRERLVPRVATMSLLLSVVPLTEYLQPAAVPPMLAATTVQAATIAVVAKSAAAGAGIISASVRELMEAVLRDLAPAWRRWLLMALLLLLLLLGLGATILAAGSDPPPVRSSSCHSAP
ncbi:MAG: RNA polymerase sigma factor [Gemmataceae bacterium]